jgi:acyl-coenzyme A synthetase/AMP-(fatty) acid ligase
MSTVLGTLINTISPFVTGNTHLLTWITYDNRRLSNSINEHEITTFITDPYVLNAMLKYNSVDFHPGLETVIVSGEHLPETTQEAWVNNTTVKLLNWFTLTENLHPIIQELQPNNKSKCLGKASPTVDLRVVDEQGNECPVGQIGILEFKSKVQGQHYLLDDTQSSFTFVNGWVHSDDLVKVDEDGTYWYVSKTKQQITINNHQLNMLDIESDILTFDEVEDCSVQEIDGTIKIDVMLQLGQELTADSIVSKLNNAAINTGCINFVELISRTLNNKKFVQFAGTTV